ncbi:hypothetical protein FEM48_Zijuj11G0006200 [Ziziphus jujuba var. spinosa]|uniref:Oligopeptide transporter 7-like n=1 Tax=Ziziphus jujuba var. spinosa TaxID=714518 RepID=A0A978UFU5_ZIZJJ|nr:hypothetical protein FEM48_Zijuj11G0006200 [Ziziphus jujuba var. spinosa]
MTRTQFFLIAFICSFAYYAFPGYLTQMLTSLPWICWIFPKSILAQQLGSGLYGLGIGTIGLDWSTISSYLGSPLKYNIPVIIDSNFHIDMVAYEKEWPLYLVVFYAITNGAGFASLAALVVHVALFHGREVWEQSRSTFQEKTIDIHTKLMKGYKQVPEWWFMVILVPSIAASIFACQKFNDQLQLPWWGILLACAIGFFFTLPMGIINAITNQAPHLTIITQYIMGYIYPGYPVANMLFRVYGSISTVQAITFLHDFKLGHYMKIPPTTMFMAQIFGTLIATIVYLGTAWWLMETIPDLCEDPSSIWTCPTDTVFYNGSVIWGLMGPRRIFGDLGTYSAINWFFLIGAIAPVLVWVASKAFPKQDWIRLVNMPVLAGLVGRHNYVLSGALDAGLAFMAVLLYFGLGLEGVGLHWWGNELDGCPLASCPTAKGAAVEGCPVHH